MFELQTRNRLRKSHWISGSLVVALCSAASLLARADEPSERVTRAGQVFQELANAENGLPINVLNKADCVIILPSVKKAGFIVGAQYGKGLMSCRSGHELRWPLGSANHDAVQRRKLWPPGRRTGN